MVLHGSPLFRLLDTHYEEFRHLYDDRFSKRYGFWRPVTDEVVSKYLQCGDLHFGFARIRWEECGTEYLRPFSCKCRGFCPSCSKRKSLDLAIFLEDELLEAQCFRDFPGTTSFKLAGFSVHYGKPIKADDTNGRKTLSEYISRAPFSLERMSFNEGSKTVLCRGEHFHPTPARNFDVASPLEWIARITSHIPKKGAKQVIYYGAYSQAWRGRERRRRQLWAVLLKKVWDIDGAMLLLLSSYVIGNYD